MPRFRLTPASSNWSKPFMTAEWSTRTDADGVYVMERIVGVGFRRCGPMSAAEADRLVAERRNFIGELQRSIAG